MHLLLPNASTIALIGSLILSKTASDGSDFLIVYVLISVTIYGLINYLTLLTLYNL